MKRPIATLILLLLAGAAWQVLSTDVAMAQDASQTTRDAASAANDGGPTDAQIRDRLVKESLERYRERWGTKRTRRRSEKCGDDSHYIAPGGPTLICSPDDVTEQMIKEHRKQLDHQDSTFLNEPQPKF